MVRQKQVNVRTHPALGVRTRLRSTDPHPARLSAQSLLRNRLAHTLALLFISLYPSIQMPPLPSTSQSLLQTLLPLLKPSVNPHTTLLVLHTLVEINEEVHDTLLKSARPFTQDRMARDGKLRDAVRENEAGLMHDVVTSVWEEALGRIEGGEGQGWAEVVEWAVRAYSGYVREYPLHPPLFPGIS
jgi:exportin-T